jgi:hypothetical protein
VALRTAEQVDTLSKMSLRLLKRVFHLCYYHDNTVFEKSSRAVQGFVAIFRNESPENEPPKKLFFKCAHGFMGAGYIGTLG